MKTSLGGGKKRDEISQRDHWEGSQCDVSSRKSLQRGLEAEANGNSLLFLYKSSILLAFYTRSALQVHTVLLMLSLCRLCRRAATNLRPLQRSLTGNLFLELSFLQIGLRQTSGTSEMCGFAAPCELVNKYWRMTGNTGDISIGCTCVNFIYSEPWFRTERDSEILLRSQMPLAYLWTGSLFTVFVTSKAVVQYSIRTTEDCLSSKHKANL